MKLAIASGKGGTGKTTLSVNLARVFTNPVTLLDCDVEEPNAHLFLRGIPGEKEPVTVPTPAVDESLCDGCGECGRFCEFNAIVSFGKTPLIFSEMCHACGGCARVCSRGAIREVETRIGEIETFASSNVTLIEGRMDVGKVMAPPLIRALKARLKDGAPAILDAPPGTSCPVIETVRDADFVLLVTEPTPFGLHDLKLAVEMARKLELPFAVAVNRAGIGDDRLHKYLQREKIPLMLEIPDDRRIAEAYSRGELLVEALPEYRPHFENLLEKLFSMETAS